MAHRRVGGGRTKNPAWYYNLAANPNLVLAQIGNQKTAVSARQLEGSERDRAWEHITATASRFADYQEKTDRLPPVIRLTPRSADG